MYSTQPPKFCGGCGETLNISSALKQKPAGERMVSPSSRASIQREVHDPDGTDVYQVPNISKLSYSIERDRNKFNLKDLIPLGEVEKIQEEAKAQTKKPKKRGRPKKN